jgi:hypothetical protein
MKTAIAALILALAVGAVCAEPPKSKMSALDQPRYKENPIYLFFESYIQDVIGFLPEEKSKGIQEMNLRNVFNTKAEDWKAVIRETLHLSDTIDIAIQDLWYRNREHFKDDNGRPDPIWFSQVFTDKFMEEDSKVDVWPPGALEEAKERIRVAKEKDKAEQGGAGQPATRSESK